MYTDFQKKWIKDNCSKTSLSKLIPPLLSWTVAIIIIVLHFYKTNNDITSKIFFENQPPWCFVEWPRQR